MEEGAILSCCARETVRQAGKADTIQFADALKDYGKAAEHMFFLCISAKIAMHRVQVLKCGVLAENNAANGQLAQITSLASF